MQRTPKPEPEPLLSLGQAARALGLAKSTLSRQVCSGQVRSHSGKVRLSEVRADRAANVDGSRAGRRKGHADAVAAPVADATANATPATIAAPSDAPPSPAQTLYADARSRKEDATARLRQMEADRLAGLLLPADRVREHVATAFIGFKRTLQGMAARFAPETAGRLGCDARQLEAEIARMVQATLTEMSEPMLGVSKR